ncbi:COX15/CtaA family protein [Micromonospora sp. NBC_01796]|uniref:COX15/CtaA family protein n=1 Tax=Micromonospora sp. NBC_01796 TaxID=2975987 RepID=UPI002DDBDCA5|nr:COX15/CtaA family protein [Micromonospora sp. NBC_01796]WSA83633.1 COX15/CtaA family protein [Micromonospora sp. NBC_01796]
MNRFGRPTVSLPLLRRLALASVVANVGIVVTGGAVRLTGSGLGCPTWPRCTDESYTTTPALGINGAIEFGNRTLTGVVGLIALAGLIAALLYRPRRRSLVLLAGAVLLGIAAQAVIGGITVRMHLNPGVVGVHFIVSMLLLLSTYAFWRRVGEEDGPARLTVPRPARTLAWLTTAVSGAVIVVGVLVTGSGPHAGDAAAARNGLDSQAISQFHADVVFLLVGLTVGLLLALRAAGARPIAVRAAAVLLAVELGQGLIGVVQYLTNLPALLVGAHMLGACLVWLATLSVLWATRERLPAVPAVAVDHTVASATPAPALSR